MTVVSPFLLVSPVQLHVTADVLLQQFLRAQEIVLVILLQNIESRPGVECAKALSRIAHDTMDKPQDYSMRPIRRTPFLLAVSSIWSAFACLPVVRAGDSRV